MLGLTEGFVEGRKEGFVDGPEGLLDGPVLGNNGIVGKDEGFNVGFREGRRDADIVGSQEGATDGLFDGTNVGRLLVVGSANGDIVDCPVEKNVGVPVGSEYVERFGKDVVVDKT